MPGMETSRGGLLTGEAGTERPGRSLVQRTSDKGTNRESPTAGKLTIKMAAGA